MAAIKAGFRQYFGFSGRATRPEFWWWMLFIIIASFVLGFIDGIIQRVAGWDDFDLLSTLFGLATLLPSLAVTCRRLHDIGKSGWWQLAWFAIVVPVWIVAIIVAAIALFFVIESAVGWDQIAGGDWAGIIFAALPALLAFIAAGALTLGVIIWAIIWLARQGEPGANRYGPDPRAPSDDRPEYLGRDDWYADYNR